MTRRKKRRNTPADTPTPASPSTMAFARIVSSDDDDFVEPLHNSSNRTSTVGSSEKTRRKKRRISPSTNIAPPHRSENSSQAKLPADTGSPENPRANSTKEKASKPPTNSPKRKATRPPTVESSDDDKYFMEELPRRISETTSFADVVLDNNPDEIVADEINSAHIYYTSTPTCILCFITDIYIILRLRREMYILLLLRCAMYI